MSEITIFFDESGYTGTRLLDPEQPYFCVASTVITDEEAEQLLWSCFPRYQGPEFKFKTLGRRSAHQAGLRQFARRLPDISERVKIWIIDKRFCALTKLVDYLIEPIAHDSGHDFYKDGFAPLFCNQFHTGIMLFGGPPLYSAVLDVYDRFARHPSSKTLFELQQGLLIMANSVAPEIRMLFQLAYDGAVYFEESGRLETFSDSNEMQLTSVLTSVIGWRQRMADDFIVAHDESDNFFAQDALWKALMRDDMEPRIHPIADGSEVEFPLRVRRTVSMRSHESFGIQLCDVLAGLFARLATQFTATEKDPFLEELLELGAGQSVFSGILPRSEFPHGPPAMADGPDAVDLMTDVLRPAFEDLGL